LFIYDIKEHGAYLLEFFVSGLKYDLNSLTASLTDSIMPEQKRGLSALQNLAVSSASALSDNYYLCSLYSFLNRLPPGPAPYSLSG